MDLLPKKGSTLSEQCYLGSLKTGLGARFFPKISSCCMFSFYGILASVYKKIVLLRNSGKGGGFLGGKHILKLLVVKYVIGNAIALGYPYLLHI